MKGIRLKKRIGLLGLALAMFVSVFMAVLSVPVSNTLAAPVTLANLAGANKNDTVTIDGRTWVVVKKQTIGSGPSAKTCVYLILRGMSDDNQSFGSSTDYGNSALRNRMTYYYTNYNPTIRAIAVKPIYNGNSTSVLTTTAGEPAGSQTQDILFAPSYGDMQEWCGHTPGGSGYMIPSGHPLHSASNPSFPRRFYGRSRVNDAMVSGVNINANSLDLGIQIVAMYATDVPAVWVDAGAVNREVKVYYVGTDGKSIPGAPVSKTYTVLVGNTFTLTNSDVLSFQGYNYIGWERGGWGSPSNSPLPSPTLTAAQVIAGTPIYLVYQPHFTITYKSNDIVNGTWSHSAGFGSGTQSVTVKALADTGFTPQPGTRFTGWNTQPNGSGTAYAPGASMPVSGNVTLYAQWGPATVNVTVRYVDAYGAISPPTTHTVNHGGTFTLNPAPTFQNYTYLHWKEGSAGSPSTGPIQLTNVTQDKEIFLVYAPHFTITYKSNDIANGTWSHSAGFGSGTQLVTVRALSDTGFTPQPGMKFLGWNTQPDGLGTSYAPGAQMPVSGNVTLYAQWGPDITTLTITKTVAGDYGDKTKEFTFVVFFGVFDIHGELHKLKHGQSVTIDVEAGRDVKVLELVPGGYTASYTDSLFPSANHEGENETNWLSMTADRTITFTNTRIMVPETGIDLGDIGPLLLLPLLLIAAIPIYLAGRKAHRRRKPEAH